MTNKEIKKWKALLAKEGLAPLDDGYCISPQEFTPPKNNRKNRSQMREALSECLAEHGTSSLSSLDTIIIEMYAAGKTNRQISAHLAEQGTRLHFTNVNCRIHRIIAHFAAKANV